MYRPGLQPDAGHLPRVLHGGPRARDRCAGRTRVRRGVARTRSLPTRRQLARRRRGGRFCPVDGPLADVTDAHMVPGWRRSSPSAASPPGWPSSASPILRRDDLRPAALAAALLVIDPHPGGRLGRDGCRTTHGAIPAAAPDTQGGPGGGPRGSGNVAPAVRSSARAGSSRHRAGGGQGFGNGQGFGGPPAFGARPFGGGGARGGGRAVSWTRKRPIPASSRHCRRRQPVTGGRRRRRVRTTPRDSRLRAGHR